MIKAILVAQVIASSELWDILVTNLAFSITSSSLLNKYPTGEILIIAPLPILSFLPIPFAHFIVPGENDVLKYGL